MIVIGILLAILARSLAFPIPTTVPDGPTMTINHSNAITCPCKCSTTNMRTTFDIVYSCLGVIFLCTYISVHHNIPDQNNSSARVTWMKLRTMLYAVLAPEIVIMWALRQRIMARRIADANKEQGWTMAHGFFLQMGGLMVEVDRQSQPGAYNVLSWNCWSKQLESESGWMDEVPAINTKEIADRGKGDVLAKAVVVLQTSWFVIQCIARHIQGLALTEIELVTVAFAVLNVVTYGLWWDKPLNVGYPIYVDWNGNRVDGPTEGQEVEAWWYTKVWTHIGSTCKAWVTKAITTWLGGLLKRQSLSGQNKELWEREWYPGMGLECGKPFKEAFTSIFGSLLDMANNQGLRFDDQRSTSVHPFEASELDWKAHSLAYISASIVGILFGAIHLAGWNFTFPSVYETWLWRVSSLVLTGTPFLITISSTFKILYWRATKGSKLEEFCHKTNYVFWFLALHVGSPLYIAARVVILFLVFFSLRALPASAYETVKWTDFIPHF